MFMYGRFSKALGVKGLGHVILMKFYQFCRQYYMLIPCFFFHRFCLVEAKTDWGELYWLGVNQGLFEGPSNQNEWG